jgi:hypothetical protein
LAKKCILCAPMRARDMSSPLAGGAGGDGLATNSTLPLPLAAFLTCALVFLFDAAGAAVAVIEDPNYYLHNYCTYRQGKNSSIVPLKVLSDEKERWVKSGINR